MKPFLVLILSAGAMLTAADSNSPAKPTAEELHQLSLVVRDYYRALVNQSEAEKRAKDALQKAVDAKSAIEAKYKCTLDVDTEKCEPVVEKKASK